MRGKSTCREGMQKRYRDAEDNVGNQRERASGSWEIVERKECSMGPFFDLSC